MNHTVGGREEEKRSAVCFLTGRTRRGVDFFTRGEGGASGAFALLNSL